MARDGDDKNYTDVLLEDINGKFDAVLEAVDGINQKLKVLPPMQDDISEVKDDVKAVKVLAKEHEQRITKLETAQA